MNDTAYLVPYLISNLVGLLFLWAAFRRPPLARLLFFLLFAWAAYINYRTATLRPEVYRDYAEAAIPLYQEFINGWFGEHITMMVTLIALGQALIAVGMLLRGWWVRLACLGVIVFLLAIAPLGYYAAFPFSLIVALAAYVTWRRDRLDYLWKELGLVTNVNVHERVPPTSGRGGVNA